MRRSSILILALAIAGVAMATFPFSRSGPAAGCASPIVSAWRHEPASSEWFGYAPLTSAPLQFSRSANASAVDAVPIPGPVESCKEAARRRLAIGAVLAGSGVLVWFLRRRRFDPPANPSPNLAS